MKVAVDGLQNAFLVVLCGLWAISCSYENIVSGQRLLTGAWRLQTASE